MSSRRAGRKGRRMELSRPSTGIRPVRPLADPDDGSFANGETVLQTPGLMDTDGPLMVTPNLTYQGTLQWLGFSTRSGRPQKSFAERSDFGTKRILADMTLWEMANMRIFSN